MAQPEAVEYQASEKGAWLSIGAYITLTGFKLAVGFWAGSRALVADGINNLTDILSSVAVLVGLRIASRPADDDHLYGHQRAETVAAVVAAVIMGLVGLDVLWSAGKAVFSPELVPPHPASIAVGLISAAAMYGVFSYNYRLSQKTGSKALLAAAYDNRSDAFTALGTVAGIAGSHLGMPWLDPLAGVLVAGLILRTAWNIGIEAAHNLMDGFDQGQLALLRERTAGVKGVEQIFDLRARHHGVGVVVDVTIGVDRLLTVEQGHTISERVEQALVGYLAVEQVLVHVEPARMRA